MPVLFGVMRGSDDTLREFLFQQLTVLVSFLRQHVRKYLPDILGLVHDFWIPTSPLMPHILRLLSELSGGVITPPPTPLRNPPPFPRPPPRLAPTCY